MQKCMPTPTDCECDSDAAQLGSSQQIGSKDDLTIDFISRLGNKSLIW